MSKIRVVQICFMGEDGPPEYVDDLGRVWHQVPKYNTVVDAESDKTQKVFDHYEWVQLELPEEPNHAL